VARVSHAAGRIGLPLLHWSVPLQLLDPYRTAKAFFWSLPGPLRESMDGLRHRLVRLWRTRRISFSPREDSDLAWAVFRTGVLDRQDRSTPIVVFEPTVDWESTLFQRPQHMATALGRKGCIVLYRTTGDGVRGVREVAPNVWLVRTPEVEKLPGAVWCVYSTASLCSPVQMAERRKSGRVVYEYIDHIDSAISGSRVEVQRLLALKAAACSGQADYLVASSRVLFREIRTSGALAPLAYIPNGVDITHFRDARHAKTPLSGPFLDFRRRHRKVVGYFGAIAPWLWFDLMVQLSEKLKDVGFVYIGPDYSGCVRRLPRGNNVLYLGAVDYDILPAYGLRFDVCFIPFASGELAKTTSPLKLYEYFALEKPVVVTADMKECTAFPEVFSGADLSTLIRAFEEAFVACGLSTYRESVLRLAHANTWDVRAETYLQLLRRGSIEGQIT
jgi:teichuronic acid biosynthesis glycosyltransferase TuaH